MRELIIIVAFLAIGPPVGWMSVQTVRYLLRGDRR